MHCELCLKIVLCIIALSVYSHFAFDCLHYSSLTFKFYREQLTFYQNVISCPKLDEEIMQDHKKINFATRKTSPCNISISRKAKFQAIFPNFGYEQFKFQKYWKLLGNLCISNFYGHGSKCSS